MKPPDLRQVSRLDNNAKSAKVTAAVRHGRPQLIRLWLVLLAHLLACTAATAAQLSHTSNQPLAQVKTARAAIDSVVDGSDGSVTAPGASYLVETVPRFTNQSSFLSSSYFLSQLGLDPERSMKRYGDGFAEQRLVADQILSLTGRKFLDNKAGNTTDNEQQYLDLLSAGVMYAKQFNLSPGIALSAQQMAALTESLHISWRPVGLSQIDMAA